MDTQVFALRIGHKYNQDVEDYINSKIPNVHWIREEKDNFRLQWNKIHLMNLDIDNPIVVIDIDMIFINDYMEAINFPIQPGEFLAAKSWWLQGNDVRYQLNGGFQKYYPKDCKYIYNEFKVNRKFWESYYINQGITKGPVNGEQQFVLDMVQKQLSIKYLPDSWFIKMENRLSDEYLRSLNFMYPHEWAFLNDEFHPDIKMVHFMHEDHPVQYYNSDIKPLIHF